jgi:cation diffusion facilitator family transporter
VPGGTREQVHTMPQRDARPDRAGAGADDAERVRAEAVGEHDAETLDQAPAATGRLSTVVALAANIGVALAKFVAWAFTGSASMLAEAVHSVADTANQSLLLVGHRRSRRAETRKHPLGFGRERFFWSFIVAIVLFTAGAVFALVEGEEKLRRPHELSSFPWTVAVLAIGFCFEAASLRTARRESEAERRDGESWLGFVRRTSVPEPAVVVLEDGGALVGLTLAFAGTTLAEDTGEPRFDAVGSIAIGVLLSVIAWTLAREMKSMLIGEAADRDDVDAIERIIEDHPAVAALSDLRTELLGPHDILVVGVVAVTAASAEAVETIATELEVEIRNQVPSSRLIYLRLSLQG